MELYGLLVSMMHSVVASNSCYFFDWIWPLPDPSIVPGVRDWMGKWGSGMGGLAGTLYTSRKSLRHLLTTGVASCEEPGSAHEETCKISREELPHPIKQRRDELRKTDFFVSLPLRCRLFISVDSCAELGWPDILGTIQGAGLALSLQSPLLY